MTANNGPVCVSVINMKGGVGKTTIAAMLCWRASRSGRKVLAVDLDPQANLSQALMGDTRYRQFLNDRSPSIVEVFEGYQPPSGSRPAPGPLDVDNVVVRVQGNNLFLIPSRFDFSDLLIKAIRPDPRILAKLIASSLQDHELVIIDCAPTESIFTKAAYHASRYILVPVRPEYFATIGFPLLNDSLNDFRGANPSHQIDVVGVVVNNAFYHGGNDGGPEKRRAIKEITEEAGNNGWHIFKRQMPHSRGFPKLMRGDLNHLGNASDAYFDVPDEVFSKIGF